MIVFLSSGVASVGEGTYFIVLNTELFPKFTTHVQ